MSPGRLGQIKNYNIVKDQKVYSAQIKVNQAFKAENCILDHKVHFAINQMNVNFRYRSLMLCWAYCIYIEL